MSKKNKAEKTDSKVKIKRWGIGKTLAVVISSVAFVVGAAILGVYLARGFDEETSYPSEISFDVQSNQNYNTQLNRLEITTQEIDAENSFELTITSSTSNITARTVTLDSVSTYAYNTNSGQFARDFLGVSYEEGYVDNGILRFPRQVTIGQPFTVYLSTYRSNDTPDGSYIDQIRGGITTISATSENSALTPEQLTIAVDTPVYATETFVVDQDGNEIPQSNGVFEVTEEEYFYVETKFYPAQSRYLFSTQQSSGATNALSEKTTFYQIDNENITEIYDSATSKHFYAENITEGVHITWFTATNARLQQEIENAVAQVSGLESDEDLYREYILRYSAAASDQTTSEQVLSDNIELNVVQASVETFEVGSAGQTFNLHDQAPLRIYVGDYSEQARDRFLSSVITSRNGAVLNNILQNVVVSFSYNGQDPTASDAAYLTVYGDDANPITIDGVNYYKATFGNPENFGTGYWDLQLLPGYVGRNITMTVSLLLENENGEYVLFANNSGAVQHAITLQTVEHQEEAVSWTDSSNRNITLTYAPNSSQPTPARVSLEGLTEIPEENIYRAPKYFVSFEGLDLEQAVAKAAQMFDGQIEEEFAADYSTNYGSLILVPLTITNDVLIISDVGQFNLYFATTNGFDDNNLYQIVQIVESPIRFDVSKTLYRNSVTNSSILYQGVDDKEFAAISGAVYLPTASDNTVKDQLQIQFTIAADSVEVFREEFNNGHISLRLLSGESDVTSYFIQTASSLAAETNQDGTLTLTYTLQADNLSSVSQGDMAITQARLDFTDLENSSNNLSWTFENLFSDGGSLALYTPQAQTVGLRMDSISNAYTVSQTLSTNGQIVVEINNGDIDLSTLISNIAEAITTTDQHDRDDTLANSWYFTSNNAALQITTGADGISRHGFSFSGEGSAALGISCGAVSAENTISFEISATGITGILYDTELDPTRYNLTGPGSIEEEISVEKYGAAGAALTLDNLIKFYVGGGTEETNEYNDNITFRLSPTYFTGKDEATLEQLFGQNGMLGLNGRAQADLPQTALQNISIESISINHNFAFNHSITLLATDQSGAVRYSFVLNIRNNIDNLSAPTSVDNIDANVATEIETAISYNAKVTPDYPDSLLSQGYIVPNEAGDGYVVENEARDDAVGKIDAGKITFYHIFNRQSQTFSVTFRPEVDNNFAVSRIINFTVKRNISVQNTDSSQVSAFETGEQQFGGFITVGQIEGKSGGFNYSFELPENDNNYIVVSGNGFTIAQNIRFDYGQTSLAQKVVVYVFGADSLEEAGENYYSQEVEIQIILPVDFWSKVAGSLKGPSTSHQVFNNANNTQMHYMVVVPGQAYTVGSYVSTGTEYSIAPMQRDSQNGNDLSLIYNVHNTVNPPQITYNSQNAIGDLLYGYGNQNVYTLLRFTSGEKTIDVAVPTIVSQIGTDFVLYAGQAAEASLENAMKSAEQLYEEGIYTEINAGETTNLYIAGDNLNGIFQPENITFSLSEGAAVGQALPSSLFKNFNVARGELSLNHLSDVYDVAYLALTYTLRNSSGATRTFNYLLKVNADVTVSQPNYPYSANGSAEYITITSSQQTINLDEEFDETTAQNGHSRFEILENETDIVSDLSHQDSIVSVQVASIDHAFTDPADWQGYINAYITNLNGNSTLVLGYPQTSDRIEIVVRRSYNGGEDIGALSVVGGTIDYHFVLNDDREYTVRAEHNGNTENGLTNYTWVLNDWTADSQSQQEDSRKEIRSFFLIEEWQQGDDAHLGTTRPGLLSFNLHKPEGEEWTVSGNSNSFTATYNDDLNNKLTFKFVYDNESGVFTATYPTYLSREFNFSSTFFTDRGELATINFAFKADAEANIVEERSFEGGQTVVWGDIFTITENGGTGAVSGYTVRIDSFKNGDNVYSAFVRAGDSGLQLASVVQNLTGDLTLTVSWGTNKSYTFTIEDFTVQANLTQQDSAIINGMFDTVIGGETIEISASDLLEGMAENSTISLSATAEQSAIASITDGENLSVTFNQVGTQTTITLPITITVQPSFSGTSTQTEQVSTQIVVNVTFVIHPSVRIEPVYPSPDGEMLDREYIESGTTFSSFGNDFLNQTAVFADKARIKATYAVNAGEELEYKTLQEALDEGAMLPLVTKTVIISSITNATVTKGETEELGVNSEIALTDKITFTRGSSGGQSLVDLSISYNNYVITYTIEIRDSSLFTLSVNSASNNISADSSSSYENVYVDKTDSENLFAENRMAKAALSNNAAAGDYYIFFETGNRVYQSKVINLSQNFVSQNQGGSTIYLDLGLNDLGSLTELVDNLDADPTSGQYKAYMFADSYYQNALDSFTDQPPDEEDILNYLTENNSNQNVFSSTFTSFELSSRITLTYAGYDVSYDEYSSMIKYFTDPEDITEKGLSDFSINNDTPLGTAVTGVDRFTFTYSNGGIIDESQNGETQNDETLNEIEKTFALQYRYMPDLDIQVGMSGEGSSVVIEVENPVRIVDAFDITRKSTGQAITMDEMVSGQAGFTLVENGNSNQTAGGQRYVGISYVQYSGDNTVYDIELTGNGAPNEGKDVTFTLTYTVGGFNRTFTVTVKVMPDYRFEVNGRVVDLGESLRFSNQDSPYVFEPDGTSALVLAGEDYIHTTDDETTTTIEPYLSVVHANSADGVELSVANFNYSMTVDETGSYNIAGNITAKLNMDGNGWDSTENPPTYYTWNKTNKSSLVFEAVKAVEFGEQYYHLVAEDDFGYQFDLYFTLSSGNTENPSISGALSLTEGETVAFGAIYEELTVQLEDGANEAQGGNLVITSQPRQPLSSDGTQVILIQNMEAWGFDDDYYNADSTFVDGDYFGGTGLTKDDQRYELGEQNLVGSFTNADEAVNFYLNSTESQKYLNVPNFVDVTIDSIAYYYQDQQVGISEGINTHIASSDSGLTNARSTNDEDYYYGVSETTLSLPTIDSDMTWIYGTGNSVQVTMVVTLKYTPASDAGNTEYYQMQQQITLSKTSQITAAHQYAADNTEITLADYIRVTDNAVPEGDGAIPNYTIYDDTLAVAVEGQSTTRFDLTYSNEGESQTVTLSAGNAATSYESLYYSSLSGAFNQVLTGGIITITPHDDNATFYYGNNNTGGNKDVSPTNKTSFTKVADVNYFRVETFNGSEWSNYTDNIGNTEESPSYIYNSDNGGYDISSTDENETIIISASDLDNSENFRISYNGVYYYPQLEFTIADITTDYITVASHYQLSSGQSQTNQYYVISWGEKAYRYTHQFSVTGTFASIESPTSIYTLPLGPSDPIQISTWAEGVTYTQVADGELDAENLLANYSGDNLYFNITSDGTSGGTGLASIDAGTGAITLQDGFTASHYVTVQIYQKVSGIDGSWGGTELSQMQLLKTIRVYPASSTQTSEGNVTLTEILPKGTYYSNASKTISIPAQTSAELVVYNGDAALNRISLENDSEQEEHQSFTIAALLGYKAVQNYSSLKVCVINSDGAFASDFTLDGTAIEEGGLELSLGEAIIKDTITFGEDNFAAKTYLILTSDDANSMLSIRTVSYQKIS